MERPDPMIPKFPGAQDQEAKRNRQAWLEALYQYEGQDKADHPMHGLYTGLSKRHHDLKRTIDD